MSKKNFIQNKMTLLKKMGLFQKNVLFQKNGLLFQKQLTGKNRYYNNLTL